MRRARYGLDIDWSIVSNKTPDLPDAGLKRLLRNLVIAFVGLIVVFIAVEWWISRPPATAAPSQLELAVIEAENAVRDDPNNVDLRVTLADAYAKNDQIDEALDQLDAVLAVQPKHRPALMGKGVLLYRRGDLEEARPYLERVVANSGGGEFASADPQLSFTYYMLGKIASSGGKWQQAVDYFVKAVTIDKGDADSLYALGVAYNELGNAEYAVESFNAALAFVPTGWCEPYEGLLNSYEQIKDEDGVTYASAMVDVCNGGGLGDAESLKSITQTKFALSAFIGLGLAAQNDSDNAAALKWYQKAREIDPTNITANTGIASIKAAMSPSPAPES